MKNCFRFVINAERKERKQLMRGAHRDGSFMADRQLFKSFQGRISPLITYKLVLLGTVPSFI